MIHKSLLLVFLLSATLAFSQGFSPTSYQQRYNSQGSSSDYASNNDITKSFNSNDTIPVDWYKIYTIDRDSTYVDTTLTIQKEYKMNFLRRDYFELLPFSNSGHAFNRLGHNFSELPLLAGIGAKSKYLAYKEAEDILYYKVPTPLTELLFRTTFEQGRMVESVLTLNLSPNFNFALSYKGFRSLGKYVNLRSGNTRFVFSFNYKTSNNRYAFWGHYSHQFFENQENGGIDDASKLLFESGNEDYEDRSVFNVRFRNAENTIGGKRYFFDHHFNLVSPKDSVNTKFLIGHRFLDEIRHYGYTDATASAHFGNLVSGQTAIADLAELERIENYVYTEFSTLFTGRLRAGVSSIQTRYFLHLEEEEEILDGANPNGLKTNQFLFKGNWKFHWKGFFIKASLQKAIGGNLLSDDIAVKAQYEFSNKTRFTTKISFRDQPPDFNYQLFKSDYAEYNWYNSSFKNQQTKHFSFGFEHPKLGGLYAHWEQITNYTYYDTTNFAPAAGNSNTDTTVPPLDIYLAAPKQEEKPLNYFKIRYTGHYDLGYFGITNTAQYQKVTGTSIENSEGIMSQALNVPEWNLRTTFSFSRNIFKKAMYLQTGITAHYFSKYYADRYNPLLADFTRQGDILVGDFPRIDVFLNGKVQRTRIYFKAEHLNSFITGYNYYSSPSYPYRDFVIRFGLVWNFFK